MTSWCSWITKSKNYWGENMLAEKIKIGVIPIRRSFLSMQEALRQKQRVTEIIKQIRPDAVELINIDDVCENGILSESDLVEQAAEKMKTNRVDALFLAFCDFGEEVVAARVAAAVKAPVLVWGARDEGVNTDQARGRDTQCGIFAATKAMARMGVKYSYIRNVPADSQEFKHGFETFVRVAAVIKSLKGLKIAQIGQRPSSFMSVISSEAALLEKFGIEVLPLGVPTILRRMEALKKESGDRVEECVQELKQKVDTTKMTEERLVSMAAFKLALKELITGMKCRGAALECWSAFPAIIGITPCFMVGELTDEGIPISCETDVNGAVTSIMMEAASLGDSVSFFADLTVRHPENDNSILLWHCGPFPYSLRAPGSKPFLLDGRGRFPLKKGDITIARFDDLNGAYTMTAVEGKAVDGPPTTGTYAYFETANYGKMEDKFVFGPYIHHVVGCYGNYVQCLREAVRLIDHVEWDDVNQGPCSL